MRIDRTPEREPRIAAWMDQEQALVEEAFGPTAWPTVEAFIEAVAWESDGDRALVASLDHQMCPGRELTPAEAAVNVAGRRTAASLTPFEHTTLMADRLGIRFEEMQRQREAIQSHFEDEEPIHLEAVRDGAPTALYRHFDGEGSLLYVGIAESPKVRDEQHRARSRWWRFVANTSLEWFEDREAAGVAERAAIRSEAPIFNRVHNKANRAARDAYLFAALDKANLA